MLTAAMLEPILTTITDNVTVILPVGMSILGLMLAIASIPKILYKFF